LIFASGKMNCVGARSMADAKLAIKKLTKRLKKARIKIKSEPKVEVQNIVASFDFGREFDLRESHSFPAVAYVPQELNLFGELTVAENLFVPFDKAASARCCSVPPFMLPQNTPSLPSCRKRYSA
jgi:hypothetical protein